MANLPSVFEKSWPTVLLSPIMVANFAITVTSTIGLHERQIVTLLKSPLDPLQFEIKRILSNTQFQVGPTGQGILNLSNPIQFNGGSLEMSEQGRNPIADTYVIRAVYQEGPAVAFRNMLVDQFGSIIDSVQDNQGVRRLAVDTVLSVGDLQVNVDYPNNFVVFNNSIPDTLEHTFLIPSNIQRFMVKVRDSAASFNIAFNPGETATNYLKFPRGNSFQSGDLDYPTPGPFSLYYQVDRPNVVVEILLWVRI